MSRPPYAQRLNRDVAELFTHNFNCSASSLTVIQMSDSLQTNGSLVLQICIYEGPYRGGCYLFGLNISESYPFRPVEVFAAQPVWHPNIDLYTGKVALPMEWSPVLTLNSLALAVQVRLII
jgi:ubiquitin-protein ligase